MSFRLAHRVSFTVHVSDLDEAMRLAEARLAAYGPELVWDVQTDARAVAEEHGGKVILWAVEITAEVGP